MNPATAGWRSVLLATATVLLVACAGAPPESAEPENGARQPEWVLSPPQRPDRVYGVGGSSPGVPEHDRLAAARRAATADLVGSLRIEISARTRSEVTEANGAVDQLYEQRVTTRIEPIVLDGLTLEDSWESPEGYLYALVALDKEAAAARVRRAWESARAGQPPLETLRDRTGWDAWLDWHGMRRHLAEQADRDRLHRLLVGRSVAPEWPEYARAVRAGYAAFVRAQPIIVEEESGLPGNAVQTLAGVWSDQGFPLLSDRETATGETADNAWKLHFSVDEEDRSGPDVTRYFLTVNARLADSDGRVRWQARVTSRGMAVSQDRAMGQALAQAAEQLKSEWLNAADE